MTKYDRIVEEYERWEKLRQVLAKETVSLRKELQEYLGVPEGRLTPVATDPGKSLEPGVTATDEGIYFGFNLLVGEGPSVSCPLGCLA